MELAFAPPTGIALVAVVLIGLLAAILPTCLYLYVEPRGRARWAVAGDTPASRRAPGVVRATAWLSFTLAQLGVFLLLVPATCAGLAWLHLRLGIGAAAPLAVTATLGVTSLAQAVIALGGVPFAIRLLSGDARVRQTAAARGRWIAMASAAGLGGTLAVGWILSAMPGLVHPALRATLGWTAVRPMVAFGVLAVVHSLLVLRCSHILSGSSRSSRDAGPRGLS